MFAATAAGIYQKWKMQWMQWDRVLMQNIILMPQKLRFIQSDIKQYKHLGNFIEQQIATNQHQSNNIATMLTEFHHE